MADAFGPAVQVLAVLSSAAGILAVTFEIIRHGRAKERSFRPAVGLTGALLGLLASSSAIWFLATERLAPLSTPGRPWTIVGAAGLLLLTGGLALALLVPTADRRSLNRVARVVDQMVQQCDRRDGLTVDQYVDLGVQSASRSGHRPRGLTLSRIAESELTVVTGAGGTGKTTTLRAFVRASCLRTQSSRRPDTVVLYVDVAEMAEVTGPVTADIVRGHLLSSFGNDTHLTATVAALLERADPRIRCVFVLDFGTVLTPAQEADYVAEVSRLVRRHPRNHALIAARTGFDTADVTIEPAQPRLQRRELLLRAHGLTKSEHRELLARLDVDPELDALAHLPATLAMIARYRDAFSAVATPSYEEFLERLIHAGLTEAGDPDVLRPAAEEAAYRLIADDRVIADEVTRSLAQAALGGIEQRQFRFHVDAVQTHLAAGHIIRIHRTMDAIAALGSPTWFPALIAALRRADPAFSKWLIDAVHMVVSADPALAGSAENDVPGTFRWAKQTLRALEVLRWGYPEPEDSGVALPGDLRAAADILIRRGIVAGGKAQQRDTALLLPLASVDTARTAVDRLVVGGGDSTTTKTIVGQLPDCPGVFARLPGLNRMVALFWLVYYGYLPAVCAGRPSAAQDKNLTIAALDLSRILRIAALGNVVFAIAIAIREPASVIISIPIIAASVAYLVYCTSTDRSRSQSGQQVTLWFGLTVGGVTLQGLGSLWDAITEIVGFEFAVALTSAVTFWLLTWPLAAICYLAASGGPSSRLWLPQLGLVEIAWTNRLPAVRWVAEARRQIAHWLWPRRIAAGLLCAVVVTLYAVGIPVPANAKETTNGVLALLAIAAFIVFLSRRQWGNAGAWRKLRWDHRQLSRLDPDGMFSELSRSFNAGQAATNRFLNAIGESKPGTLHAAAAMLVDLDNLMEFLEATLPSDLKEPIKDGFWLLAPVFQHPGFTEWATEFDRRHPGMLINFATTERDREYLSSAVQRAQGTGIGG